MTKPSTSEPSATPQPSARDSHGNQSHGNEGSSSASASREIFQGLFKDLGKQAMAMESILRLVCGKVDKLEHWVTEMSFGMTELDLKLRNIAHNIEGTAANVDDVASVSRWAVPVEDDPLAMKAATTTVIKKVGVGLHKKKQMRMTGMVANILDQLTTVAETPPMVESEGEAHKSEDGGKKKKGKKAKDREKAKARGEHATGGGGGGSGEAASAPKDNSPREAESKDEVKEKHKAHKNKKANPQQPTQPVEEATEEKPAEQVAVVEDHKVVEEDARQHEEVETHEDIQDDPNVYVPPYEEDAKDVVREDVSEDKTEEDAEEEEEATREPEAQEVHVQATEFKEEVASEVNVPKDVSGERQPEMPVEIESVAEHPESIDATEAEKTAESTAMDGHPEHELDGVQPKAPPPAQEDHVNQPQLEATPIKMATPTSHTPTVTVSSPSPPTDEGAPKPVEVATAEPTPTMESPAPLETYQSPSFEQTKSTLLSPIPSSRAPADEPALPATASLPQPTIASPAPQQQHAAPVTRLDLPAIRLEPLVIQEATPSVEPTPSLESHAQLTVELLAVVSNEPVLPAAHLRKASSKKLSIKNGPTSAEAVAENGGRSSPSKRGSRKASIRQSISQRQPSMKKRRSQLPPPEASVAIEGNKPTTTVSAIQTSSAAVVETSSAAEAPRTSATHFQTQENETGGQQEGGSEEDDGDDDDEEDDDDDDDDSSMLSSDSDGSVLDLGVSGGSGEAARVGATSATSADKKMSAKMTRTLTALNKLQKANVLSPDEIAELKQRATQKWFRLRDHVKEKNKKDVTNILLKRKKNIFTVSNRIELLEEKSREVYASIKQLNTELKGKIEASTFEGLRRHVHDIHASLQVLDQKISKGDIPTMEHVKQLAAETEGLRVMLLEQLANARDHCDANHDETLKMFEEEWTRVAAIEKSMEYKLETLAAGFDAKILALPDYADALEGIRRAIRKKADLKALRELEAKLLGHDAESEDCLIRCLSCHKEVVNTNGHDATSNGDDNDVSVANSPHFKRVNPGTVSAKVYRSNMPLNAQPLVISESTPELFSALQTDEATTPNAKAVTPSRRAARNEEPRPSPLSFIHVTATRAMAAAADTSRPISAPSTAIKKKTQPTSAK